MVQRECSRQEKPPAVPRDESLLVDSRKSIPRSCAELEQRAWIAARGREIDGSGRDLSEGLVRALFVVHSTKYVERALLCAQVPCRGLGCLCLQCSVKALLSSVFLRFDSEVRPPAPTLANGAPLSERIAAGNTYSWKAESKMR